jgi:hypothetical protein
MDYFIDSGYLADLEDTVTVDALHGVVSTSNITSCNSDFVFTESYQAVTTLLYTSNLVSSNIQTTQLSAQNAGFSNLIFNTGSGSNLYLEFLASGIVDAVNIETSTLICTSNLNASSVLANYIDATTILGSNIYLLHELIDRSNATIVDSNGKIDWNRLKNFPESDGGLDIFNLAQSAYDLAQLGYDMYQQLQSLLGNTPALPDNIKDPLGDALGDSNENSSNAINFAWERVFRRPRAASNYSIGIKKDLYTSDLSKLLVIPTRNFSTNNGSLYNTTSTSNCLIDFTTQSMYPQVVSLGSNHLSSSNVLVGSINLVGSNVSTVSNVPLQLMSMMVSSNNMSMNSASIADTILLTRISQTQHSHSL